MTKQIGGGLVGLALICIYMAWGPTGYAQGGTSRTPADTKAQPAAAAAVPTTQSAAQYKAVLAKYCVSCHNERLKTGDFVLDTLDIANPHGNAEQWEKVVRKLKVGMMPPLGQPRPDQATYDGMTAYLETALDRDTATEKNPGRPRG